MNIEVGDATSVTTAEFEIISHKKAIVVLEPGCIWADLNQKGRTIGLVFLGPSRFVVDAITETKHGAIGESVSGQLSGIQIFLGSTKIESSSKPVSSEDLKMVGFVDDSAFKEAIKSRIDEMNGSGKIEISEEPEGSIFLGKDEESRKVVLVLKEDNLVFTLDKKVLVLGDKNYVSVTGDGVAISGPRGRTLRIGKDGITGLEELKTIGPRISRVVSDAMSDIWRVKGLKSLRHSMRDLPRAWDDVDELDALDWDEYQRERNQRRHNDED